MISKGISVVMGGIIALIAGYSVLFLYKNFYHTLAQVDTLEELQGTVSRERLNKKVWDEALVTRIKKIEANDKVDDPSQIQDPFASD